MDDFEHEKGRQTVWERWLAGPPRPPKQQAPQEQDGAATVSSKFAVLANDDTVHHRGWSSLKNPVLHQRPLLQLSSAMRVYGSRHAGPCKTCLHKNTLDVYAERQSACHSHYCRTPTVPAKSSQLGSSRRQTLVPSWPPGLPTPVLPPADLSISCCKLPTPGPCPGTQGSVAACD